MSIVAQVLLNRKRMETWAVRFVVDVISVGLYLTSALYALNCRLAVSAFLQWRSLLAVSEHRGSS